MKNNKNPPISLAMLTFMLTNIIHSNALMMNFSHTSFDWSHNTDNINRYSNSNNNDDNSIILHCNQNKNCTYVNNIYSNYDIIECNGDYSCIKSTFVNLTQLTCNGIYSCIRSKFINIKLNIDCNGDHSCGSSSTFESIDTINCNGQYSCSDGTIFNNIDYISCKNNHTCQSESTFNNISKINCNGFSSCTDRSNFTDIQEISCSGDESCNSYTSFVNVNEITCDGWKSCSINVKIRNGKNVACNNEYTCSFGTTIDFTDNLFCNGNVSCKSSSIFNNINTIGCNGAYSCRADSIFTNISIVTCDGQYSCTKNTGWTNTSEIDCSGYSSCSDNSNFDYIDKIRCSGDKSCNSFTSFTDIDEIKCNGFSSCADYDKFIDIYTLICSNRHTCKLNVVMNFIDNLYCNGSFSCQEKSAINFVANIVCSGWTSCQDNLKMAQCTTVKCSGYRSCCGVNMDKIDRLKCDGYQSCANSSYFKDIVSVSCNNEYSCSETLTNQDNTITIFDNVTMMQCSGESTCTTGYTNELRIGHVFELKCTGKRSCVGGTIGLTNISRLSCNGYQSCSYGASLNDIEMIDCRNSSCIYDVEIKDCTNVICNDFSCQNHISITNINTLQCHGYESCSNTVHINYTDLINCTGDISCTNQDSFENNKKLECNGIESCSNNVTIKNIQDYVECNGHKSCSNAAFISNISNVLCNGKYSCSNYCFYSNIDSINCYGKKSCIQFYQTKCLYPHSCSRMTFSNSSESIYCAYSQSCVQSTFINLANVLCYDYKSCMRSKINQCENVLCDGKESCTGVRFDNVKYNSVSCTGNAACINVSGDIKSCPETMYVYDESDDVWSRDQDFRKDYVCDLNDNYGYAYYPEYMSHDSEFTGCNVFCYGRCFSATKKHIPGLGLTLRFPLDTVCLRWYYHWIVSLPSCTLCMLFGMYFWKTKRQISNYLNILNINLNQFYSIRNSGENIADRLFNQIELDSPGSYNGSANDNHNDIIEMSELNQLKNDWNQQFDQIVKGSVDETYNLNIPNGIWEIILQYTMGTDDKGYIQHKLVDVLRYQTKMLMFLNKYIICRMVLEVFVLLTVIIYFCEKENFYSNQYDFGYNYWQKYQMFNATLCVTCFVLNPLFILSLIIYIWERTKYKYPIAPKSNSKQPRLIQILKIFVLYNFGKYILQILIGLPLYFVGLTSFLSMVALVITNAIICFIIKNDGCLNLHPKLRKNVWLYVTIAIVMFLSQHIFFVSFNIVSGHMWFASSIRSFFAYDACYDNSIFLDVSNTQYDFIQIFVYATYWLP